MVSIISRKSYVVQVNEGESVPPAKFWSRRRILLVLFLVLVPSIILLIYFLVNTSSESSTTPYPVTWAANVNYTIYAGPTDLGIATLETRQNWTEIRLIDRRYDSSGGHQQLESNYFCGGYDNSGTCCIFNDCDYSGNVIPSYQIGDCHIFYNGSTIWEWYPWIEKCTKMFDGVGMITSDWWDASGLTTAVGWETITQPGDVTQDQTCYKYTDSSDQYYWIKSDGTPCKHEFGMEDYSKGVDMYDDWVLTPGLTDPFEIPSYCPDFNSDPVLELEVPNQIYICTGYWFSDDDRSRLKRLGRKSREIQRA